MYATAEATARGPQQNGGDQSERGGGRSANDESTKVRLANVQRKCISEFTAWSDVDHPAARIEADVGDDEVVDPPKSQCGYERSAKTRHQPLFQPRELQCRPPNVKLCRGRFHKMQVGGRAVPKGTTRCGRPPASLDGRRSPTAVRWRTTPLERFPRRVDLARVAKSREVDVESVGSTSWELDPDGWLRAVRTAYL